MRFEQFLALLGIDTTNCTEWPYAKFRNGYPMASRAGRVVGLHREACRITSGPAPAPGMQVAHSCGNRACINPRHLRWATAAENAADRDAHGTTSRAQRHGMAKLANADVVELRRKFAVGGITHEQLAAEFGISRCQVGAIIARRNWASIA